MSMVEDEPRPVTDDATTPSDGDGKPRFLESPRFLVASILIIFSVLCLGFLANLLIVSQLVHARDQEVLYSDFRSELANAIAPVGQTDVNGALLRSGAPVAILEIPDLGMKEVVVEGTTSSVTQSGPGHKRDTVLPGQPGTSVIYGRQAAFGAPFGQLEILQPGMTIVATTGQGPAEYRVIGVRRPGDPLPPVLEPGQGRLTLVTAMGPRFMPTDLLRVDAELVTPAQPAPPRLITAASLDMDQRVPCPVVLSGVSTGTGHQKRTKLKGSQPRSRSQGRLSPFCSDAALTIDRGGWWTGPRARSCGGASVRTSLTGLKSSIQVAEGTGGGPPGACVGAGCPLSATRLRLSGALSAGGGKGSSRHPRRPFAPTYRIRA